MAFKIRRDKPVPEGLVAGIATMRLKKSLKPAEQPHKRELIEQQGCRCHGCQEEFADRDLVVNHVIPVAKGGGWYHIDNLQLLCRRCNQLKGNGTQEHLITRLRELGIAE